MKKLIYCLAIMLFAGSLSADLVIDGVKKDTQDERIDAVESQTGTWSTVTGMLPKSGGTMTTNASITWAATQATSGNFIRNIDATDMYGEYGFDSQGIMRLGKFSGQFGAYFDYPIYGANGYRALAIGIRTLYGDNGNAVVTWDNSGLHGNGAGFTNLTRDLDPYLTPTNLLGLSVDGTTTLTRAMGNSFRLDPTNTVYITADSSLTDTNGDVAFSFNLFYGTQTFGFVSSTMSNTVVLVTNAWNKIVFWKGYGENVLIGK